MEAVNDEKTEQINEQKSDALNEEKQISCRSELSKDLIIQILSRGQAFETDLLLRAIGPLVQTFEPLKKALNELRSDSDATEYETAYLNFRNALQNHPHLHEMFHIELRQDRYGIFKQAQEIVPGVFLSSEFPLIDGDRLLASGITHVVQCNQVGQRIPGITYLNLNMRDCETQNARANFVPAFDFIKTAVDDNKNVLVHCEMGVSRSATVVIAYCMQAAKLDYADACALVRRQRPIIDPNPGFISQLMNFESHINYCKVIPPAAKNTSISPSLPTTTSVIVEPSVVTSSSSEVSSREIPPSMSSSSKKRSIKNYLPKFLRTT